MHPDPPLLGIIFLTAFSLISFAVGVWVLTESLKDLKAARSWLQRIFYFGVMIFGLMLIRAGWYWLERAFPQPWLS